MSSPQHCLAMAHEADRLAGIVSYERDKMRLQTQAAAWRQMAAALAAPDGSAGDNAAAEVAPTRHVAGWGGWLKRRRA